MTDTPRRLSLPIRVSGSGALHTLEQDSDREIAQSLGLLLDTRPGERRSVPDYGLPDPVFGGLSQEAIGDVVSDWEDRADPLTVEQLADTITAQQATVYQPAPDLAADSDDDFTTEDEEA